VADGIVVNAAAALTDPEFVGAFIVVLPHDPVVSHDPAAKARQPVSHHPASWPPAYPPGILDLRLGQLRFSPCRTVDGVQTRTPWSVQTMIWVAVPPLSIVDSRSIRRTVVLVA